MDKNKALTNAINKGVAYLNKNAETKEGFMVYPLLLFLKDQKNLPLTFSTNKMYSLIDTVQYNIIKPVVAFANKDSALYFPKSKLDTANYITCLMYYSFNYPVVNDTAQITYYAKKLYTAADYNATHCYFSLQVLIKRFPALEPSYRHYLNTVRETTLKLADSGLTPLDLRTEAFAMLSEEDIKLVNYDSIQYILSKQAKDGSWHNSEEKSVEDKLHSTVLAVWTLTNWVNKK